MTRISIFQKAVSFFKAILGRIKAAFGRKSAGDVNYIVALPVPLSTEEEAKAIELLIKGEQTARNLLIEHNLRLVVYIAKRFNNTGIDIEELISVGTVGLIKAVKSYNSEKKIKLATYASRCIENEILMFLRKMVRTRGEISLDEPLNVDWEGNKLLLSDILGSDSDLIYKEMESDVEKGILKELVCALDAIAEPVSIFESVYSDGEDSILVVDQLSNDKDTADMLDNLTLKDEIKKLPEKEKEILLMRYFKGDTQMEISQKLNISQAQVSRLEKSAISRLRKAF